MIYLLFSRVMTSKEVLSSDEEWSDEEGEEAEIEELGRNLDALIQGKIPAQVSQNFFYFFAHYLLSYFLRCLLFSTIYFCFCFCQIK